MGKFISGRHTVCADPDCTYRGGLDIIREHWDAIDKVIIGEEHCPACTCMMLYSRKPMPTEREAMAGWAHMQVLTGPALECHTPAAWPAQPPPATPAEQVYDYINVFP